MLEDMRPTMERAKISDKFIIFAECNKLPGYCLEDAYNWLSELYTGAYKECKRLRGMQSEEMWKRYELWGDDINEHRECVLYAKALDAFKKACRGRPLIFKHNQCIGAIEENNRKKPKNKAKKVSNDN